MVIYPGHVNFLLLALVTQRIYNLFTMRGDDSPRPDCLDAITHSWWADFMSQPIPQTQITWSPKVVKRNYTPSDVMRSDVLVTERRTSPHHLHPPPAPKPDCRPAHRPFTNRGPKLSNTPPTTQKPQAHLLLPLSFLAAAETPSPSAS